MPSVLRAADQRLTEVRKGIPDAGALVIASDQDSARAYAKLIREITGRGADRRPLRRHRRVRPIDEFSRARRPVDGRRPDGVRGRRRASAGRRGVRHDHLHAALLRPGRRTVRAVPAARRDRVRVPADRARPPHLRQRDGGRARPRPRQAKKEGEEDPYAERERAAGEANREEDEDTGEQDMLPSRRSSPTPSSTGSCTTAPSSACRRTPGARRSRTTSGFPGCSSPTRCSCCPPDH